jgi:hypothetical protein
MPVMVGLGPGFFVFEGVAGDTGRVTAAIVRRPCGGTQPSGRPSTVTGSIIPKRPVDPGRAPPDNAAAPRAAVEALGG